MLGDSVIEPHDLGKGSSSKKRGSNLVDEEDGDAEIGTGKKSVFEGVDESLMIIEDSLYIDDDFGGTPGKLGMSPYQSPRRRSKIPASG